MRFRQWKTATRVKLYLLLRQLLSKRFDSLTNFDHMVEAIAPLLIQGHPGNQLTYFPVYGRNLGTTLLFLSGVNKAFADERSVVQPLAEHKKSRCQASEFFVSDDNFHLDAVKALRDLKEQLQLYVKNIQTYQGEATGYRAYNVRVLETVTKDMAVLAESVARYLVAR